MELIELNIPVERDEDGAWSNPAIPDFDEDMDAYNAWIKAQGLEVTYTMLESEDLDHPAYVHYFDEENSSFADWNPEPPTGDGWYTFSIHDTEDGPAWVWASRVAEQGAAAP